MGALEVVGSLSAIAVVGVGVLAYRFLQGLPDQVYQRSLKRFEYDQEKDLQQAASVLRHEHELTRARQAELQIHKTEQFLEFTGYFNAVLADPSIMKRVQTDRKKHAEFKKKILDLGARLYFFGSDETVRTYLRFRRLSIGGRTPESSQEILTIYGELMVSMRRDLGYNETDLTADDFLRSIIVDWDAVSREKIS